MKGEIQKLPGSKVELIIEESIENVAKHRASVIKDAAKHVDIKGFRKGAHIPEDIIIRQIGEEIILQMTVEKAIEKSYRDTLRREKLMPVSQAEIKEVISQSPLKVKIELEVFPEVSIDEKYKKIKLKKNKLSVSQQEVDAAIADIETRFTHFHDTDKDHAAHMGDRVTIDTDGYDENGELLESTSMRDYTLILGSNMLVPGFEEDMVGMKMGEERELDVTFPTEYHNADFAGKKTKFKVTAKKIEHAHKPEFTPEFIEGLRGEKMDLPAFKELIQKELLETKQMNDAMDREMKLIDELLQVSTLEIGDKLLSQQTEMVFNEIKENIAKDGVRVADYLESLGLGEEEYKKQHVEATALKRLQGELILSELTKQENTEVSEQEMSDEIEKIMSRYQSEDVLNRLRELYIPGNKYYEELRRRMGMRKLIDSFFEE